MRHLCTVLLTMGLVVLLANPAATQQQKKGKGQFGQFGFGFGGGGGGYATLLQNEGVQKEIKLDESQIGKVKEAATGVREKYQDSFAKLRDLGREEQREKMTEISAAMNEDTLKAAAAVLKEDQLKRLKQIEIQQAGSRAFVRADIQKTLGLTSEQKEKVKIINDDFVRESGGAFGGFGKDKGKADFQAIREKASGLRKEAQERIQSVLTSEQKTTWKSMTGEPFEVTFQFRRPDNNE